MLGPNCIPSNLVWSGHLVLSQVSDLCSSKVDPSGLMLLASLFDSLILSFSKHFYPKRLRSEHQTAASVVLSLFGSLFILGSI